MAVAEGRQFRWGDFDCCLWACDVVALMRGLDLAAAFRGRYSDARGAARSLRDFAGRGLEETARKIAEAHGFSEIPVALAQRGDIALVATSGGDALGVVLRGFVVGPGPNAGLARVPLGHARIAWAV